MEYRRLGTLVERKIGYGIVQPGESIKDGVPVIKVNNLISGLNSISELDTTTVENDKKYARTRLVGGELIVSVVGTIGKTAVVPASFSGCNLVRAIALIDVKEEWLAYWVKYYIDSPNGQAYIAQNLNTTVQPTLNIGALINMPIPFYEESVMKRIVAVLHSIDKKISCNMQINTILHQQAQEIFKKEVSCINPLPKGWSNGSLLDIAKYINGLAMQRFRPTKDEDGLPVLKIKELRQGSCDVNSELCSPNIKPEYIIHDGDVVFSWSGSLLVDLWCGGTCGLNQHLFKVISSKYPKWFYYLWTLHHLDHFVAIAADKATTMGHIKREDLERADVVIPESADMERIGSILQPICDLIINNRIENRKLSTLRNTILPKLMSGKVDVSSIRL